MRSASGSRWPDSSDLAAAIASREHRAESLSVGRLLTPRPSPWSAPGQARTSVGHQVLRNLLAGGFQGPVYPVNPRPPRSPA